MVFLLWLAGYCCFVHQPWFPVCYFGPTKSIQYCLLFFSLSLADVFFSTKGERCNTEKWMPEMKQSSCADLDALWCCSCSTLSIMFPQDVVIKGIGCTCDCIFTFVTWSCRHLEDSSWCSPSGRGRHHRFCRLCGHSWRFRSWWRHFRDTLNRWGNPHMTAPSVPSQMARQHGWTLGTRKGHFVSKRKNRLKCFLTL